MPDLMEPSSWNREAPLDKTWNLDPPWKECKLPSSYMCQCDRNIAWQTT